MINVIEEKVKNGEWGFVKFMVNKAAFIDYQLIPKFWLDYFDMDIEYW